ncbi:MAG: PIN domain-containing protein [Ardenticatenaceae bacterium]|nr:PIN domain-containing protein [Ardenticatenaceae bacterium]MCB8988919.1 PIN domain-containing protein [Ardenticatenaceae bacterium]
MPSSTFLKAANQSPVWLLKPPPFAFLPSLKSNYSRQPTISVGNFADKRFLALCERIDLTSEVVALTIRIRREYKLKIPDAIVAASALVAGVPLVTADAEFKKIEALNLITDILT